MKALSINVQWSAQEGSRLINMRGIKGILITAIVALGAFFAIGSIDGVVNARDYSDNAVIKGGTYSMKELRHKYNNDTTKGTKDIFRYFGITSDTVNNKKVSSGYVTRGGDVVVDGKVVADNAVTAGRQYIAGGSKKVSYSGTTFYTRKPSVSFQQSSLSAYVFFNSDGTFAGAVVKDCGNPVKADNKVKPKNPAVYCTGLTSKRISKTNDAPRAEYRFTASAKAVDGAKVTGYTFSFSDGSKVNTTKPVVDHTFKKSGTYTVTVTVKGQVNGKTVNVSSSKCKVTVKVSQPEAPKQIKVCELATKEVITIDEKDFDSSKHSKNLDDCKEAPKPKMVEVCEIATGETVTVTEDKAKDTSKYAPVGDDKCKVEVCDTTTGTIVTIDKKDQDQEKYTTDLTKCDQVEVCNPETGEVITVNPVDQDKYAPVGDEACQETPEVPETPEPEAPAPVKELPQTGLGQAFSGVFGLGAMTAASYYFVTSRRS